MFIQHLVEFLLGYGIGLVICLVIFIGLWVVLGKWWDI